MIKLKIDDRSIRQTTAVLEATGEDGSPQTQSMRVEYYSLTIAQLRAQNLRVEQAKDTSQQAPWISEILIDQLHSLPDVVDGKNKPVKITLENLERLPLEWLQAIQKAINDDISPKQKPTQ